MGIFLAIDLKSFYASVECIEKGYDPLDTNLVVADASRTEKTICLAVSPSLKKYGISGRARLFEVIQIINKENNKWLKESHYFNGESSLESKLQKNKHLKIFFQHLSRPPESILKPACFWDVFYQKDFMMSPLLSVIL